jgi:AcrR family transcriptional regulator
LALRDPFQLPQRVGNSRGARSVQRILEAAANLFGREGFQGASMHAVARAAGVSKGLLHYHFRSKEHLLLEAQRATFRQIHRRFDERFRRGDRGLEPALEALDALWEAIREMHDWAPFMVETMSQAIGNRPLRADVDAFYAEAMTMLEEGITTVFADQLHELTYRPERLARMVRAGMHGLVVELAWAQTNDDLAQVAATYSDLRDLFAAGALPYSAAKEVHQ